jgi:hypothetical protein
MKAKIGSENTTQKFGVTLYIDIDKNHGIMKFKIEKEDKKMVNFFIKATRSFLISICSFHNHFQVSITYQYYFH